MASEEQHVWETQRMLGGGDGLPEVHRILDQFAHFPDGKFLRLHRKFLHHQEGILYIAMRFGNDAGRAATLHVITDCGHVPMMADYHNGAVDNYGVKTQEQRGYEAWREDVKDG